MYELKIVTHFAAAHQLREYEGGCERLHGHNWTVEVFVAGDTLGENGLLVDFKLVKEATQRVLDALDHRFLNDLEPFRALNPSSENIARYIFERLAAELDDGRVHVSRVTAWESENACATYSKS
ncbi:6-carboxy-5,6,7,8-tetrahydropterin synthase [uncultured Desulfatiglans sp.]|nr:6-carboxy-5,6,7,8-tetrahydropterin synthase [uncultured Desulfatiglans sp.]